jgi:hypothetical protein
MFISKDILGHIFSYNDCFDYQNFYLVDSTWRKVILESTQYWNFIIYLRIVNFSWEKFDELFQFLCNMNELKMVKWIYFNLVVKDTTIFSSFRQSCLDETKELSDFLFSIMKIEKNNLVELLQELCYSKSLDFIKWYCNLTGLNKIGKTIVYPLKCYCTRLVIYQKFNNIDILDNYLIDHQDCIKDHVKNLETAKRINKKIYVVNSNCYDNNKYSFRFPDKPTKLFGNLTIFTDINNYFCIACQNELIDNAARIYLTGSVFVNYDNNKAFQLSCLGGRLNSVRFLYGIGGHEHENFEEFHYNNFKNVCKYGHLSIARFYLLETKIIKNKDILDEFFEICCMYGHYELARWVYSVKEITDTNTINRAFQNACKYGSLSMVKWIYAFSGKKVDIFANNNEAINICCYRNHIEIIKWLFKIKENEKDRLTRIILHKCCIYGQLNILDWLFFINRNFSKLIEEELYLACLRDNVCFIEKMISLNCIKINEQFIETCVKFNSIEILRLINY